jgi:hypothetical protein
MNVCRAQLPRQLADGRSLVSGSGDLEGWPKEQVSAAKGFRRSQFPSFSSLVYQLCSDLYQSRLRASRRVEDLRSRPWSVEDRALQQGSGARCIEHLYVLPVGCTRRSQVTCQIGLSRYIESLLALRVTAIPVPHRCCLWLPSPRLSSCCSAAYAAVIIADDAVAAAGQRDVTVPTIEDDEIACRVIDQGCMPPNAKTELSLPAPIRMSDRVPV